MRAISKRLVKLAKYSTNEQKEVMVGSVHFLPQPPKEEVDFILGEGPNKEMRALKFQNTLGNYILNQVLKNHELMKETSQLKDKIVSTTEKWKDEVVKTKDEVVETERRVTSTTEKWKEAENELSHLNEKLLRLTNNFNVRGAIEFVRAEILGLKEPSGNWKESWDNTLARLHKDSLFCKLLEDYSQNQKVKLQSLEKDMGGLYHKRMKTYLLILVSTYAHSGNKEDIIIDEPFSYGEQIVLAAVFDRYKIPYKYRNKDGELVTNPFKESKK